MRTLRYLRRLRILPADRALRGGSFWNNAENLRVSARNRNPARNRNDNIGFRVAVAPANTLTASHRAGAVAGKARPFS